MCSCIFRILFRVNEIICMNIHGKMYHSAEKSGNRKNCGKHREFRRYFDGTDLWKNLWRVCITFCINGENPVGTGQKRGWKSNF